MEKLLIKEAVHLKEIKERMQRAGRMQFCMVLRNDSYRGFDKKINIQIDVLKDVKRAAVEYDDEDIQAQKAPSLMQQMMEVNPEGSDDEEEEEDDNTTSASATPAAATASGEQEPKKDK